LRSLGVAPQDGPLLGTIYFAFFTNGMMSVLLGALMPHIREENALSYSGSGALLSAHQFGNLCALFIAGFLPYMIGRKRSSLLMGAGMAAGLAIIAAASGQWLLLAAFALTGIGRGTMSNICNAVVSEISARKTAALNLLHAAFAVGALLSPPILLFCAYGAGIGWRGAALAVAAFAAAALFFLGRGGLSNATGKKESGASFAFLKDAQLWMSVMIRVFYLCAEASVIGWFVVYFTESGVLPPNMATLTPTMMWLMMMTGRVICAALSSRVDRLKLLLGLSGGVTLSFAGMLFSRTAAPCIAFLLCFGLSMGGIYPTAFSTVRGTSSTMATGFVIATATLGAILMPGIVGAVADTYGLAGGVATILAALGGMLALVTAKLITAKKA
jgi:fucose permease